MTEDIRGSAPAMTTKDMLAELHHDMKYEVLPLVAILKEAKLVERVSALESWRNRTEGGSEERKENRLAQRSWVQVIAAVIAVVVTAGSALGIWDFFSSH